MTDGLPYEECWAAAEARRGPREHVEPPAYALPPFHPGLRPPPPPPPPRTKKARRRPDRALLSELLTAVSVTVLLLTIVTALRLRS